MRRALKRMVLAVVCAAGIASPVIAANTAQADPAGFPDLDSLPTARTGDHSIMLRHYSVALLTPNRDVGCAFRVFDKAEDFEGISCSGNIPGTDSVPLSDEIEWYPCSPVVLHAGQDSGEIERQDPKCTASKLPGMVFQPGRKIVEGTVTRGATGDVLIACINSANEHGFVISRSRTWTF